MALSDSDSANWLSTCANEKRCTVMVASVQEQLVKAKAAKDALAAKLKLAGATDEDLAKI